MKKLSILLALILVVSAGAFADVDLSGEFMFGLTNLGADAQTSQTPKAEINLSATVDDNTTVAVELDAEGGDWTDGNISLDDFRVSSNIAGVFGIEAFSLTMTAGYFDTYFTNWNYVSRSGEEFYYTGAASAYLFNFGPKKDEAVALDFGVAGYSVKFYQDLDLTMMGLAFSGSPVEGSNFLVGYYAAYDSVSEGNVWAEAGYTYDSDAVSVYVPAVFTYGLGTEAYGWSSGVAADVAGIHASVGVGGTSATSAFKDCLIEVSTSMVENTDLYAIVDLDTTADSVFQSVDLGGKYNLGALGIGAGFVVASGDDVSTIVYGDNGTVAGNGAYLFFDIDY